MLTSDKIYQQMRKDAVDYLAMCLVTPDKYPDFADRVRKLLGRRLHSIFMNTYKEFYLEFDHQKSL